MRQGFKDHFSQGSGAYRDCRPDYPPELFGWLASLPPRQEAALDCGCGTGQASVALAAHFQKVYAVDPSEEQIRHAIPHERVSYLVAPAEATGLPEATMDLVIAAQSLHWFDFDRFYAEVRRVAREGAFFAAFTYGLLTVDGKIDAVLGRLYHDILGPYWPPERAHVDAGYRTLPFPFTEIVPPSFIMRKEWQLERLVGYIGTWSAVKEYRRKHGVDPVAAVAAKLRNAWGAPEEPKNIEWPLVLRVGRIA
ncbi:MAG: methyltransferase domain-containing protein [Geobacter sp.]|nr:methyltransferase domain-containing protein [Geobacter sp.]